MAIYAKGKLLSKMLLLATTKHDGQFDMGGNPYILHPLKVMYFLKSDDEELQCIALGHDLIEDTDVTFDYLMANFTSRIAWGILFLTKIPNETEEQALERICSSRDAMRVKLCDLRHNSDIRRLKGITEKDVKRVAKYHRMWTEIAARLRVS